MKGSTEIEKVAYGYNRAWNRRWRRNQLAHDTGGDAATRKSVMEKIKVTRQWNPKIDADLFIEEEYAFDTAERVYKGGDVLGVERISFG